MICTGGQRDDGITSGEVMERIVGEALKVKATVAGVARRYGLSANQLSGCGALCGMADWLAAHLKRSSNRFMDETWAPVLDAGRRRTRPAVVGACPRRPRLGRARGAYCNGDGHYRCHKLQIVSSTDVSVLRVRKHCPNWATYCLCFVDQPPRLRWPD